MLKLWRLLATNIRHPAIPASCVRGRFTANRAVAVINLYISRRKEHGSEMARRSDHIAQVLVDGIRKLLSLDVLRGIMQKLQHIRGDRFRESLVARKARGLAAQKEIRRGRRECGVHRDALAPMVVRWRKSLCDGLVRMRRIAVVCLLAPYTAVGANVRSLAVTLPTASVPSLRFPCSLTPPLASDWPA